MAKSAIAWPTWRCRRLASLAISTGSLRRGAASRRRSATAAAESGGGRDHDSYNARCTPSLDDEQCIGGPRATDRRGHRPRRRLAPVQPLHGAGALRARARLLRQRPDRSSAACPASAATSSPRPSCRRCSAARWRARSRRRSTRSGSDEVWEFGAGSRRARRRAARRARRARPPLLDRRAVGAAARAPARSDARVRRPRPLARRAARADERRRRRQRGARRDAGRPAALRRRGLARARRGSRRGRAAFAWADRPTDAAPAGRRRRCPPARTTETARAGQAFVATLAERLERGAVFFVDYGFPEAEYYHPQRRGGTLMCHRGHRADTDPLVDVGLKDITAHVDFTGVAARRPGRRLDVARLHVAGALSPQLRPRRAARPRPTLRGARRCARSSSTSTRWASCSR